MNCHHLKEASGECETVEYVTTNMLDFPALHVQFIVHIASLACEAQHYFMHQKDNW